MDRTPKHAKNLNYDLERLIDTYGDDSKKMEFITEDWAKQYRKQGDRKMAGRCEQASNDIKYQARYGDKK